jgi:hypothetical protein
MQSCTCPYLEYPSKKEYVSHLATVFNISFVKGNEYESFFVATFCRNPSLGLATKAKGLQGCEEARESRQRHCKGVGQEDPEESHHILLGVLESVKE